MNEDEIRMELKVTQDLIRRLEGKIERRDVVLFGEDGRGGLVGEDAERRGREKILAGIVYGLILPVLVGLLVHAALV